jgi:biotin carboxylase
MHAGLSLTGARPFSASDASDDMARRRTAHKPDDSASPSSPPSSPSCHGPTPSMEITVSAPSNPIVGSTPGELSRVNPTTPVHTLSLQQSSNNQVITDMTRQIYYDSQAIAHLLQQRESDSATIRNMEQAFNALRLDHIHAEQERQTQHITIQGGSEHLIATHQRLLAT